MNWDVIQAFLAVAEAGSISRAAERLGQSQPTLSRQIAAFERQLGSCLFERKTRGLRLTEVGARMVEPARRMQAAAQQLGLAVEQARTDLVGTVRVAASEMTATRLLPEILVQLRARHPGMQFEIVVSNELSNLLAREADIAVRHVRPTDGGVIARELGAMEVCAWARADYLDRMSPAATTDPRTLDWLGLDQSDPLLRRFHQAGLPVDRSFFALRCDDQLVLWPLALAGAGVGFAPAITAARWPAMRPVLPALTRQGMPVWLASHRELRQSALIRTVFEELATAIRAWLLP